MAEQRYYVRELLPRFDVPDDAPSQSTCCNCGKNNIPLHKRLYNLHGRYRVYCSMNCMNDSYRQHKQGFIGIARKVHEIQEKLNTFTGFGFDIHDYISANLGNMYEFNVEPHDRVLAENNVKEYFKLREDLVKLLIQDAFAGDRTNTLALDIALLQIKDMFQLDILDSNYLRKDGLSPKKEYLLSLLLFIGRFEEHYNVSVYYARRGEQFLTNPDMLSPYDDSIGTNFIKKPFVSSGEDITSSYFDEDSVYYRHFPRLSMNHMFINKFTLHMNMESLRLLRINALDNEDCIALIGEYVGLKKEWFKYEKNWYKDQAMEVLKEFTRSEELASQFGTLHGCSDVFLGSGHFNQISMALKIGRGMINKIMLSQKEGEREELNTFWVNDMNCRTLSVERLEFIKKCIEPNADTIVGFLNGIAGYNAYDSNHFIHCRSATHFLTRKFLGDIDEELDSHETWDEDEWFSDNLLRCLLGERKQIQAHLYHIHCLGDDRIDAIKESPKSCTDMWAQKMLLAHEVMNSLPSELNPLSYRRPLPLPDDDPFLNHPLTDLDTEYVINKRKIHLVGGWLDDVTRVIDALFYRGLATNENLTAIFGDSSMVSYRLYELRKIKAGKNQTSITSFFSRKKARRG